MAFNYYIFDTKAEANAKNGEIYDLYVTQPIQDRGTLYAYAIFGNGSDFAMEYDGSYEAQGLLDGLTPITEQEALNQGFNLEQPIN